MAGPHNCFDAGALARARRRAAGAAREQNFRAPLQLRPQAAVIFGNGLGRPMRPEAVPLLQRPGAMEAGLGRSALCVRA